MSSDNISPLHLMDVKRIAFETKPVTTAAASTGVGVSRPAATPTVSAPKVDRAQIAALVDRFLADRAPQPAPAAAPPKIETPPPAKAAPNGAAAAPSNGHQRPAMDFVCEEDVKRAVERGEKIYVNARTIITPAARDLGDGREIFVTRQ